MSGYNNTTNVLFSKISPQNLDFFIDRRRFIDADTVLLFRRNAICSFVSTWRLKMIYFLQIVLEERPGHLPKL